MSLTLDDDIVPFRWIIQRGEDSKCVFQHTDALLSFNKTAL